MRITSSDLDFSVTLVFLDGKWVRGALAADDEEGWVEVPDLAAMAPLEENMNNERKTGEIGVSEWEEIKVMRKTGLVTFKRIT